MWIQAVRLFNIIYGSFAFYFLIYHGSIFALHPFLMTIAFALLLELGIEVFYMRNGRSLALTRKKRITLHWIIQSLAALGISLGFACIYLLKEYKGKNHFTTWHGTIGLAACVCVVCSAFGGISNMYRSKFTTFINSSILRKTHKYFGIFTFLMGLMTIGLGFMSSWAESELSYFQRCMLLSLLFPYGISVLYRTVKQGFA